MFWVRVRFGVRVRVRARARARVRVRVRVRARVRVRVRVSIEARDLHERCEGVYAERGVLVHAGREDRLLPAALLHRRAVDRLEADA